MKTDDRGDLPQWLFKPKKIQTLSSSTVAGFSPESGVKSNKGFQSLMLRTPTNAKDETFTLLINDSTLAHELANHAVYSAKVIDYLLKYKCKPKIKSREILFDDNDNLIEDPPGELGFNIYIIKDGDPVLLESTEKMSQGDFINDAEKAKAQFIALTSIPADDLVILDFAKMNELRQSLFNIDITNSLPQLIMDQWAATNTLPEGQGLPAITIDGLDSLGKEGMEALFDSTFTFNVRSSDIGPGQTPHHKIETLRWNTSARAETTMRMPALKHVSIEKDCIEEISVLKNILQSSLALESLELYGEYIDEKVQIKNHVLGNNEIEIINNSLLAKKLIIDSFKLTKDNIQSVFNQALFSEVVIKDSEINDATEVINIIIKNKYIRSLTLKDNTYEGLNRNDEPVSAEHLEKVCLTSKNDTEAFGPLFKTLSNIRELTCLWSNSIDTTQLSQTSRPNLTWLDMSGSDLEAKTLETILRHSPNIELLNLSDMTISAPNKNTREGANWKDLPLTKVKTFIARSRKLSNSALSMNIIVNLLSVMNTIENLDLSVSHNSAEEFNFQWEGHSFTHVKKLKLNGRPWNKSILSRIIKEATYLQVLDLSNSNNNDIWTLCEQDIRLEHLEDLSLCGSKFDCEELSNVLKKATRVMNLNLSDCTISGSADFYHYVTNIIDIKLENAHINDVYISVLFNSLSPIAANLNAIYNPSSASDTTELIIDLIDDLSKIITLKTNSASSKTLEQKLFHFHSLRSLTVCHPLQLRIDSRGMDYVISEIIITSTRINQKALHAFIQNFKHLKKLTLPNRCMDSHTNKTINMKALASFIEKDKFIFKRQLIASFFTGKSKDLFKPDPIRSEVQTDTIIGTAEPGVVYAGDHVPRLNIDPIDNPPSYHLKPQFKLVYGPDLNISNVRKQVFYPDYDTNEHEVLKKKVPHILKPYTIMPCTRSHFSVYRKPTFDAVFNDPIPELGLDAPWIELSDLSPHDQLLACHTSNQDSITINRCDVYGKFYLILKSGYLKPQNMRIEYEVAPDFHPAHRLPQWIREEVLRYSKPFQSRAPESFKKLNLKDKLIDIYEKPNNHACESRALSFGYLIEFTNKPEESYQLRIIKSSIHSWCEILYKGNWHTIDLGGAPGVIEYDNDIVQSTTPIDTQPVATQHSNTENNNNNNNNINYNTDNNNDHSSSNASNSQTYITAPSVIQQYQKASTGEIQTIARFEDLAAKLSHRGTHDNILIICKAEMGKKHVNMVRRFVRSLEPDSIMVDTYEQALSSKPYIKLNFEDHTWEPINPTGAAGWMLNEVKALTGKKSRIIVDWSSMSSNQITKMNACIDLKHRHIDGVPIHADTQVIGLICENDPLLKDESFLSRHGHRLYRINARETIRETPKGDTQILNLELYHSVQWQRLILGMLGFNAEGNPIHQASDLLDAKKPLHIIINNPPEQCTDFDRFIHDLEDGRSFNFADKSFTLPRMKVTLTHGYPFDVLKKSLKTLNTNISPEMLETLSIDHVVTPSTFERCLQTRSIKAGKLMTAAGWLAAAKSDKPLSLYITRTLSEQQYCFLLKSVPAGSLHIYCAPGVVLPKDMSSPPLEVPGCPLNKEGERSKGGESIFDISECTPDDLLYRFDYEHNKVNNSFTFHENVSAIWKKLEQGENIILTGIFSDELMDHLATLLLPKPYLWHDGQKKTFHGKLILQPSDPQAPRPPYQKLLHINDEIARKSTVLQMADAHPIVCIEGKPGIGKSCFIREMKADPSLNCYSFDPNDTDSLKAWAASQDSRPTILFIDEFDKLGTDFTMLKGRNNPKREILVEGDIFTLSKHHYIVLIGNHAKQLPSLIDENTPRLAFDTLTKEYVINHILTPIFAEADKDTAESKAKSHYNAHKTVREMQAEAILICSKSKIPRLDQPTPALITPFEKGGMHREYHLTESRKPLLNAILDSIQARQFMQQAHADAAKYGGQTGHMLEGLPGIGKSDIIHAAMRAANINEINDLNKLYDKNQDHRNAYYRIGASCSMSNLRKHLRQAFDQGCIVHIDELDALLKPDTPEKESEVTRLIAELNAYLMGEDTQHNRPQKPGFMLLASGNGISYNGRAELPASIASRLHMHKVTPYTQSDCISILSEKFPALINNYRMNECIQKHVLNPQTYTFRTLLTDVESLNTFVNHNQNHQMPSAAGSSNSTSVKTLINKFNQPSNHVLRPDPRSKSGHSAKFGQQ